MRSRTSRGVLEWSGGEDLYIGSQVSDIGKVSGVTGIVSGPPEGSRGSTGWATYPGGPHGLKWEGEPAPGGLVRPPWAPLRLGLETLGGGGAPLALGGTPPPLAAAPTWEIDLPGPAPPPPGGLYKGGGEGGQPHLSLGASLPLLHLFLLPQ